jgi:hypothetical protein
MPDDAIARARALLAEAAAELAAAGARTELRVERLTPRPVLGIRRSESLRATGPVWRLGVLLLDADPSRRGVVYATGAIVRATDPGHSALQSVLAGERRELRVLAQRAHLPDGATVNVDAPALDLDAVPVPDPLTIGPVDGRDEVLVRWTPHSASQPIPLAAYVADRVALLRDPPPGA